MLHFRYSSPPPAHPPYLPGKDSKISCGCLKLFSSVTQPCPNLCNPMDCSIPCLPVHHQLLELVQTHIRQFGDAIQLSHPVIPFSSFLRSFPASASFPMNQFFISGGQSIGASASHLPVQCSGLISFRIDWFDLLVFPNNTVQMQQFFSTQLSLWSNSYIHTWLLEKP